jgi:hypothetical protein
MSYIRVLKCVLRTEQIFRVVAVLGISEYGTSRAEAITLSFHLFLCSTVHVPGSTTLPVHANPALPTR